MKKIEFVYILLLKYMSNAFLMNRALGECCSHGTFDPFCRHSDIVPVLDVPAEIQNLGQWEDGNERTVHMGSKPDTNIYGADSQTHAFCKQPTYGNLYTPRCWFRKRLWETVFK